MTGKLEETKTQWQKNWSIQTKIALCHAGFVENWSRTTKRIGERPFLSNHDDIYYESNRTLWLQLESFLENSVRELVTKSKMVEIPLFELLMYLHACGSLPNWN